jgi:hypothetical protein
MQPTGKDRFLAHPLLVIALACLPIIFGGCAPIILTWMRLEHPDPYAQAYAAAHPLADKYVTVWSQSALTFQPAVSPMQQSFSEDDRAHVRNAVTRILRARFARITVVENPAAALSGPYKTVLDLDLRLNGQVVELCLNVFADQTKVSELCSRLALFHYSSSDAARGTLDRVISDLDGKVIQYLRVPVVDTAHSP